MQRNDSRRSNGIARTPSRRRVLSLGTAGIVSALGGCSSITGQSTSTPGQSDESVFKDISFEKQYLVVELFENNRVERLNLIGPSGTAFANTEVLNGETRVEIPIIRIEPGDSMHYPLGESELVAELDERNLSDSIELQPRLEIVEVNQHSGSENKAYGNVEATISNTGSAPTWVYDLYYENPPYPFASKSGDGRGSPSLYLNKPDSKAQTIIQPGQSQTYVGQYPPFIFESKDACDSGPFSTTLVARTGFLGSVERKISSTFSGKALPADAVSTGDRYVCKEGTIEVDDESEQ